MNEELKIKLGVNEWLKLIKEDKNLNGAYISICQYIYLTEKENQELKKQLQEKTETLLGRISELRGQQKEFIKYLKDEIKQNTPNLRWKHYNEDGINDYDVENPSCIEVQPTYKILEEILQKYKSIIGVSDEKEN